MIFRKSPLVDHLAGLRVIFTRFLHLLYSGGFLCVGLIFHPSIAISPIAVDTLDRLSNRLDFSRAEINNIVQEMPQRAETMKHTDRGARKMRFVVKNRLAKQFGPQALSRTLKITVFALFTRRSVDISRSWATARCN